MQQAMEEIAQAAVRQHVLYQEGESQPRPELLPRLDAWLAFHRLIRSRICTASRESTITAVDLESVHFVVVVKTSAATRKPSR